MGSSASRWPCVLTPHFLSEMHRSPDSCCLHRVAGRRMGQIMHTAEGSTVTLSVRFTDRPTHICINKLTFCTRSASDNSSADPSPHFPCPGPELVLALQLPLTALASYQSRTASALRCVTLSAFFLCSHSPTMPLCPFICCCRDTTKVST